MKLFRSLSQPEKPPPNSIYNINDELDGNDDDKSDDGYDIDDYNDDDYDDDDNNHNSDYDKKKDNNINNINNNNNNNKYKLTIEDITIKGKNRKYDTHLWRCLGRHIINNTCCQEYIEKFCPRWKENYLAFISIIPLPEGSIISNKDWLFKFNLVFEYQCKLYAYPIRISYESLKRVQKKIEQEERLDRTVKFFPWKKYPSPFQKSSLSDAQRSIRKADCRILKRISLPWFIKLTAAEEEVEIIRKYIQHLFSSPALLAKDWFYKRLLTKDMKFCKALKELLKKRAEDRLKKWKKLSEVITMNLENLKRKPVKQTNMFHTAYVIRRTLKDNKLVFHWALAFEGEDWLLRVEYFDEHIVNWILLKNDTQNRRAFWFDLNPSYTERWLLLLTLPALRENKPLHMSQIGHWIESWHERHVEYHSLSNNCQHFVRDIVSHFNTNKGLDLNGLMDVQSGTALVPGMMVSHGVSQFARTYSEWEVSQTIESTLRKKLREAKKTADMKTRNLKVNETTIKENINTTEVIIKENTNTTDVIIKETTTQETTTTQVTIKENIMETESKENK